MTERLPSLPLFVDDYEAATAHLTLEEDGVYMRLLRLCWRTPRCSIPDEADWIMRRLRVDQATYDRVVTPIIAEFFTRQRGRVLQKRLLREFERANEQKRKKKEAGKKGGFAKALKNNDSDASNATVLPEANGQQNASPQPQPQPQPQIEEPDGSSVAPKRAQRLPSDFEPVLTQGAQDHARILGPQRYAAELQQFRDHHTAKGTTMKDWQAAFRTWLGNAVKWTRERNGTGQPSRNDNRDGFATALDDRIAARRSGGAPGPAE